MENVDSSPLRIDELKWSVCYYLPHTGLHGEVPGTDTSNYTQGFPLYHGKGSSRQCHMLPWNIVNVVLSLGITHLLPRGEYCLQSCRQYLGVSGIPSSSLICCSSSPFSNVLAAPFVSILFSHVTRSFWPSTVYYLLLYNPIIWLLVVYTEDNYLITEHKPCMAG